MNYHEEETGGNVAASGERGAGKDYSFHRRIQEHNHSSSNSHNTNSNANSSSSHTKKGANSTNGPSQGTHTQQQKKRQPRGGPKYVATDDGPDREEGVELLAVSDEGNQEDGYHNYEQKNAKGSSSLDAQPWAVAASPTTSTSKKEGQHEFDKWYSQQKQQDGVAAISSSQTSISSNPAGAPITSPKGSGKNTKKVFPQDATGQSQQSNPNGAAAMPDSGDTETGQNGTKGDQRPILGANDDAPGTPPRQKRSPGSSSLYSPKLETDAFLPQPSQMTQPVRRYEVIDEVGKAHYFTEEDIRQMQLIVDDNTGRNFLFHESFGYLAVRDTNLTIVEYTEEPVSDQQTKISWSDQHGLPLFEVYYSENLHYSDPLSFEPEGSGGVHCCSLM